MNPTNKKIIVRCDINQKNERKIGDILVSTAIKWEVNYRYRSPTVCEVVEGNRFVSYGDILLVHHNLLYLPSPFHLQDDLFSIPFSKVLFAKLKADGELDPICGNMLCEEIEVETIFPVPPDQREFHKNRYKVTNPGWLKDYKVGDIVFTRPYSGYKIIYNINGVEKSVTKVDSEMVCGVLKPERVGNKNLREG